MYILWRVIESLRRFIVSRIVYQSLKIVLNTSTLIGTLAAIILIIAFCLLLFLPYMGTRNEQYANNDGLSYILNLMFFLTFKATN